MAFSMIYTANTSNMAFTTDDGNYVQVPFGSVVRRKNCGIMLDGGSLVGMGGGYYDFDVSLTLTPDAIGPVKAQLFQDGVAIPGATATGYAAAAGNPLNISFPAVARQCGRCCNTVFTLGINASATVNNFVTKAKKTD